MHEFPTIEISRHIYRLYRGIVFSRTLNYCQTLQTSEIKNDDGMVYFY